MARKLSVRTKEMARAQDRAEAAHNKLENVTELLRKADIKVELIAYLHSQPPARFLYNFTSIKDQKIVGLRVKIA